MPLLTPAAALAAASTSEGFADLTVGIGHAATFVRGQRDMVPVVVENRGRSTQGAFSVNVVISKGFQDISVRPAFEQGWQCDALPVNEQTGITTVICKTSGLDADSHKAFLVTATAGDDEDLWMVAIADPLHRLMESNEENNVAKRVLGSVPWIPAQQYQDSGYRPNGPK